MRASGLTAEHFRQSYIKALLKSVNDEDRQILLRPGFEAAFCAASAECFAHGSEGLVRDSELLYRHWAFDVGGIRRPVHMWQGLADTLVPPPINKEVADRMPGSIWHPVEGAGHFVAIGSADDILAIAAKDLAAAGAAGLAPPSYSAMVLPVRASKGSAAVTSAVCLVPGITSKRGSKSTMVAASFARIVGSPSTLAVPSLI